MKNIIHLFTGFFQFFFGKRLDNRTRLAWPYMAFMIIFVVLPVFLLGYYAMVDEDGFTTRYFVKFFTAKDSVNTLIFSTGVALQTTIICILLGYPAAYIMANRSFGMPQVIMLLFILPMWINLLLRTLATVALFDFIKLPLDKNALLFGLVYDFLPYMIYPIYNTLQKVDPHLIDAAQDLGANRTKVFWRVVFPLSLPGVYSGIVMVFMPAISTFAVAELLTMNNIKLFGSLIEESVNAGLLNLGAAMSLVMLIIIGLTSFFGNKDDEVV